MKLVWDFDVVSPYSYLQFEAYPELVRTAELRLELFWGLDATDMLHDYLEHPCVFDEPAMQRIANLPIGAARKP